MLFIFAPYLQMPIMWIHKLHSQATRIILTVVACIWSIFIFTQKTPETSPVPGIKDVKPPISSASTSHPAANELKSETDTSLAKGNRIALGNFEKDLEAINMFALKASGNAGGKAEFFGELYRKIDAVNVQQIPPELRDAWSEYRNSIQKFLDYLQSVKLRGQSALRPATGTKEWAAMVDEARATVETLLAKKEAAATALIRVGKDFGLTIPDVFAQ